MSDSVVPSIINLELTNACNLSCVFCDRKALASSMDIRSMDTQLLDELLEDLGEHCFQELGLVGLGEPLLDKCLGEHLEVIRRHAWRFAIVSLNTNLLALDRELAELICSSVVSNVTISLNATNAQAYRRLMGADAFERVVDNIRLFMDMRRRLNSGQKVGIQVMASDLNRVGEIESIFGREIRDEAKVFIREIYNKPSVEREDGILGVKLSDKERYPCWSLYSRVYVDVNGNVYPCTIANDCYRENSSLCLGNVRDAGIVELFNNDIAQTARDRAERGELAALECGSCNVWLLLPNHFRRDGSGCFELVGGAPRREDLDWQGGSGEDHD